MRGRCVVRRGLGDGSGLPGPPSFHGCQYLGVAKSNNRTCQKRGIDGAGPSDGQRADRNAAGIWTMERRLSWPFKAALSTGTPSTGKGVMEAVMPGRCAAPPAPAMITFSPRPLADEA